MGPNFDLDHPSTSHIDLNGKVENGNECSIWRQTQRWSSLILRHGFGAKYLVTMVKATIGRRYGLCLPDRSLS